LPIDTALAAATETTLIALFTDANLLLTTAPALAPSADNTDKALLTTLICDSACADIIDNPFDSSVDVTDTPAGEVDKADTLASNTETALETTFMCDNACALTADNSVLVTLPPPAAPDTALTLTSKAEIILLNALSALCLFDISAASSALVAASAATMLAALATLKALAAATLNTDALSLRAADNTLLAALAVALTADNSVDVTDAVPPLAAEILFDMAFSTLASPLTEVPPTDFIEIPFT
jgi:hypothetical protein